MEDRRSIFVGVGVGIALSAVVAYLAFKAGSSAAMDHEED